MPLKDPQTTDVPTSRNRDAEATREKLLVAAVDSFSSRGFDASSTRAIEEAAGVKRGLISYHFGSKQELWEAAARRILSMAASELGQAFDSARNIDGIARLRYFVRAYVRMCARLPELNRLMIQEGMREEDRLQWLIEHAVGPWYQQVCRIYDEAKALGVAPQMDHVNFYYVLTGAATLIFSNQVEARLLTGIDPTTEDQVGQHADALANLIFPETHS